MRRVFVASVAAALSQSAAALAAAKVKPGFDKTSTGAPLAKRETDSEPMGIRNVRDGELELPPGPLFVDVYEDSCPACASTSIVLEEVAAGLVSCLPTARLKFGQQNGAIPIVKLWDQHKHAE